MYSACKHYSRFAQTTNDAAEMIIIMHIVRSTTFPRFCFWLDHDIKPNGTFQNGTEIAVKRVYLVNRRRPTSKRRAVLRTYCNDVSNPIIERDATNEKFLRREKRTVFFCVLLYPYHVTANFLKVILCRERKDFPIITLCASHKYLIIYSPTYC